MRNVKKYTYVILGFFLIFTFQNCSTPLQFQNIHDQNLTNKGDGAGGLPDSDLDDAIGESPEGDSSASNDSDATDAADVEEDESDFDEDQVDTADNAEPEYNYETVNYSALCDEIRTHQLTAVLDGQSIKRVRDENSFAFDHIERIYKSRGKMALVGQSGTSDIKLVHRFRGQMLICYADVARLKKVRGDVIIVGGDVGDVTKFRGNLILLGGQIKGKISKSSRANIVIK